MRIAITGASGFIGTQIVRHLSEQGHELVLFGRDRSKLARLFPDQAAFCYDELHTGLTDCDIVFHLAAALPTSNISDDAYVSANVTLTKRVAETASGNNVPLLVNFATLGWNKSKYSETKKEAEAVLAGFSPLEVITLRLPAVYGNEYRGRLAILNKVPAFLRSTVFQVLASLRPTVHVQTVLAAVDNVIARETAGEAIVSDRQAGNWIYAIFRLVVDYGFALTVTIFLWWLMVLLYVVVRATSSGPGIFAQERIGKDGDSFVCYKFRTMQNGTKSVGTHEVSASSVTKVGAFLRRTKLDELPQVINIFRREVSLIGPRPCLPVQLSLIDKRKQRGVFDVLPGITGLAQVNGIDMSNPDELAQWDAKYLALRSIPLDCKILIATFLGRGGGDRVG